MCMYLIVFSGFGPYCIFGFWPCIVFPASGPVLYLNPLVLSASLYSSRKVLFDEILSGQEILIEALAQSATDILQRLSYSYGAGWV